MFFLESYIHSRVSCLLIPEIGDMNCTIDILIKSFSFRA